MEREGREEGKDVPRRAVRSWSKEGDGAGGAESVAAARKVWMRCSGT